MPTKRATDMRSRSEKDCDRILYSSAFRRLAGVTQVTAVGEIPLFHNRLTHTIKVSQLAKRLAQDLIHGGFVDEQHLDPEAAAAAGLAHDLGHPPFGHIAEEVLQSMCTAYGLDGFEGNAQSFRIVTKLSRRASPEPGLGLSQRTLNGILKYPWFRSSTEADPQRSTADELLHWKKWGAYASESEMFVFARDGDQSEEQSLEAAVMDWCDDISYALHDMEDFYRAGLLPLERLAEDRDWFISSATTDLHKKKGFDPELLSAAFRKYVDLLPGSAFSGSDIDRQTLHERTNGLIDAFFGEAKVSSDRHRLVIDPEVKHEIMLLKQLTWQYVVNNPALTTLQQGQQNIVKRLFDHLVQWQLRELKDGTPHRLPTRLRRLREFVERDANQTTNLANDSAIAARAAADYIAGLTEDQAVDLYRRLEGLSGRSILEGWVRW